MSASLFQSHRRLQHGHDHHGSPDGKGPKGPKEGPSHDGPPPEGPPPEPKGPEPTDPPPNPKGTETDLLHPAISDNSSYNSSYPRTTYSTYSEGSNSDSTSFYTSANHPDSKGPKGPKESKGSKHGAKGPDPYSSDPSSSNSILMYISMAIIVIITILFIIKWLRKDKQLLKQSKNAAGKTFLIMFTVLIICFLTGDILVLFTTDGYLNFVLEQTSGFVYRFGRGLMSLFFLLRLKLCFTGSTIEISLKKFYAVFTIIMLSYMVWLIGFGFLMSADHGNHKEILAMHAFYKHFENVSWIIDSIVNVVILLLFMRGIWKTAIPSNLDITNNELTKSQMRFLNFICKNTNLAIWGLTSSMFPQLYGRLIFSLRVVPNNLSYHTTIAIDGAINIVCIYLIFRFCDKEYKKICKCCNQCLSKCCIFFAKNSLTKIAERRVRELAVYTGDNIEGKEQNEEERPTKTTICMVPTTSSELIQSANTDQNGEGELAIPTRTVISMVGSTSSEFNNSTTENEHVKNESAENKEPSVEIVYDDQDDEEVP